VSGSDEYGNKPSGSVMRGEFLDQMRNYQLVKNYDPFI
jgi:hypothetical protein